MKLVTYITSDLFFKKCKEQISNCSDGWGRSVPEPSSSGPSLCPQLLHGLWEEMPFVPPTHQWFEHFLPPSTAESVRMEDGICIQCAAKSWCFGKSWWGNGSVSLGVLRRWVWGVELLCPGRGLALFRVAWWGCVSTCCGRPSPARRTSPWAVPEERK